VKGKLGKKVGMTQVFDERGESIPVTVIEAGPCWVTQIKTVERDGYDAVQLGFGDVKPTRLSRGQMGHLGQFEVDAAHPVRRQLENPVPVLRHLREFRVKPDELLPEGSKVTVEVFEPRRLVKEEGDEGEGRGTMVPGDRVDVVGSSKGRGFAGTIKRHGFRRQPKTHGQSDRVRAPGSIGATTGQGRVFKGMRMSGRMGNHRVTAANLEVVLVDPERNLLAVRGSVPGPRGGLVMIKQARKQG